MTQAREAIKNYASDNGKTIADIAGDLGMGRVSLFNKMRGKYDFTLEEAYMLSRKLGCTIDDFYVMTKA